VSAFAIEGAAIDGQISQTFEGRDVFAPVAARLGLGEAASSFGPAVSDILAYPAFRAPLAGAMGEGMVVRVDRFGNLITDIRADEVAPNALLEASGHLLATVLTYDDAMSVAALAGSSGFLEIAARNGNAASLLRIGAGSRVRVIPGP
jgi:S-adenosylmethionine hydrolase